MTEGVVSVQFINYLLTNDTIKPILEYDIDASYFPGYEDEFKYLIEHYEKTKKLDGVGKLPDKVSFAIQFPDFPLYEVTTPVNTLFHDLLEQKCYSELVQSLQASAEKSKTNSFEAINFLKNQTEHLFKLANKHLGEGVDIVKSSTQRLEDYKKRIEVHGLMGISTGISDMDKELHGWLNEDFVLIIARTNEGKSWLLLYFMLKAWLQGKKVAVYSGEMSPLMYGYRFDTMYKHFRNSGLISGDVELGSQDSEIGPKTFKDYQNYINDLLSGKYPDFRIFTPKDFGGEKMSVNKMRVLQDKYGFDIWGLDQLSLMHDDKKGKEIRIRYTNISEDLARFTEDYQVPIICLHQANRKAAESKKKDPNATPELEDSQDADAIAQNATRVISFTQIENGAKIKVPKNRYGKRGQEFLTVWNIDYGIFKSLNSQNIKDNLF